MPGSGEPESGECLGQVLLLGSAHGIHPEAPGGFAQQLHPHCASRETEAGELGESAYSLTHVFSGIY